MAGTFEEECGREIEGFASAILWGMLLRDQQLATKENEVQWARAFSAVHGMPSSDWDAARTALQGLCNGIGDGASKSFAFMAREAGAALKIYEKGVGSSKKMTLSKLKEFVGDGFSADSQFKGFALGMCAAALAAEKDPKWSNGLWMDDLSEILNEDVFMFMKDVGAEIATSRRAGPIKAFYEQADLARTAQEAKAAGGKGLKL